MGNRCPVWILRIHSASMSDVAYSHWAHDTGSWFLTPCASGRTRCQSIFFRFAHRYTMEFLQPSMDSSRRIPIRYHVGGGVLILYIGIESTEGLSGTGHHYELCPESLRGECQTDATCPRIHVGREWGERITEAFNVDCLCTRCFKLTGTPRSLLQCMLLCLRVCPCMCVCVRMSCAPVSPILRFQW